ncbi:carbohydrate ABC transporter permease [Jannaschia rubra]|uniref:carbohydrate ABC transporter permease n=1 Tax=Jannaschia rubra TaxID=282197 RepID=UPI002490804F|nr:carbohydrate ABC transporter permease [Jannaschia rubra]
MSRALGTAVLLLAAVLVLLPFVYMIAVSLAPAGALWSGSLLPRPGLAAARDHYAFALTQVPLLRYMANGAFVCGMILLLQVLIAAPAGYALAKLPFRGRGALFGAVILALMIPIQVPAIPLYVGLAYAGLLNTYTALILPFVISAFAIFLFRQFFASYPDEVLDAARLNGFSELAIVWRLMLPAAWPAVAAFATISVIAHWNDLYWPLVVITDTDMMTPPLGLAAFRSSGESTGNPGALMAGGVMVTAPLVIGFVFFQRHLIRGLGIGAT